MALSDADVQKQVKKLWKMLKNRRNVDRQIYAIWWTLDSGLEFIWLLEGLMMLCNHKLGRNFRTFQDRIFFTSICNSIHPDFLLRRESFEDSFCCQTSPSQCTMWLVCNLWRKFRFTPQIVIFPSGHEIFWSCEQVRRKVTTCDQKQLPFPNTINYESHQKHPSILKRKIEIFIDFPQTKKSCVRARTRISHMTANLAISVSHTVIMFERVGAVLTLQNIFTGIRAEFFNGNSFL